MKTLYSCFTHKAVHRKGDVRKWRSSIQAPGCTVQDETVEEMGLATVKYRTEVQNIYLS